MDQNELFLQDSSERYCSDITETTGMTNRTTARGNIMVQSRYYYDIERKRLVKRSRNIQIQRIQRKKPENVEKVSKINFLYTQLRLLNEMWLNMFLVLEDVSQEEKTKIIIDSDYQSERELLEDKIKAIQDALNEEKKKNPYNFKLNFVQDEQDIVPIKHGQYMNFLKNKQEQTEKIKNIFLVEEQEEKFREGLKWKVYSSKNYTKQNQTRDLLPKPECRASLLQFIERKKIVSRKDQLQQNFTYMVFGYAIKEIVDGMRKFEEEEEKRRRQFKFKVFSSSNYYYDEETRKLFSTKINHEKLDEYFNMKKDEIFGKVIY